MFDPAKSVFSGMTTVQLQAALSSAQTAYINLSSGAQAVDVSYTQGESAKRVTFIQTDLAKLNALIRELQACLGIVRHPRQRAARFVFR